MDLQLKEKCALVTGASRGLGFAAAMALAREGCRITINSRDKDNVQAAAEQISSETGANVTGLVGDLGKESVARDLVQSAAQAMGGLDLLFTNAGGPPSGAFESFDEQAWQSAIDLSFTSHVRLIRAALPYLRKSNSASVLTVTSLSVKQPIANLVLSNSIRAATVGLTKSLALELGKDGIRFNSILPGWTETERVRELMAARAKTNGTTVEQETIKQTAESPLGRIGQPEEFAKAACFLLSPAASYITGVMLSVDGGMYKGIL
jgi:3-oxoacyl-[acyl-carrier protein] reductase